MIILTIVILILILVVLLLHVPRPLSGLLDRQSVRFKTGEIHHTWVIYDEHYQIAPPKQPKHEIQLQTWNIILEHLSSSYWVLSNE